MVWSEIKYRNGIKVKFNLHLDICIDIMGLQTFSFIEIGCLSRFLFSYFKIMVYLQLLFNVPKYKIWFLMSIRKCASIMLHFLVFFGADYKQHTCSRPVWIMFWFKPCYVQAFVCFSQVMVNLFFSTVFDLFHSFIQKKNNICTLKSTYKHNKQILVIWFTIYPLK